MSNRRKIHRTAIGPLAAGAAVIGAAAFIAAPAQAAPAGVTVTLNGSLLTINGDSAANSLTVGRTTAGAITLNGTPVLGGTATTANVSDIVMDGGAGNDTLRLDETSGLPLPRIEFRGGEGNDQLAGGSGGDTLLGGPGADTLLGNGGDDNLTGDIGNDKVIGGPGNDTVSLGDGSDQFTWNPGDGDDQVDGEAGTDTLIFNGSDADETVNVNPLAGDASRARVERFTGTGTSLARGVSFTGFELLKTSLAGGTDLVNVTDHGLPGLNVLRVDLGTGQGDHAFVQALGSGPADATNVRISGSPAAGVTVSDLPATVLITGATMIVQVSAGSGNDIIDATRLAAGTVTQLIENGNDGNDTLIGSPGHDQLFGGFGTDRFEERGGNDFTDAVPGEVVIP